jgi:hypothetical protein
VHLRAEVSTLSPAVRKVLPLGGVVARPRLAAIAASLLGAVTALGMVVVLLVGAVTLALVVSRLRESSPGSLASGLVSETAPVSVLGALLLSAIVVTGFACGGYVAARLAGTGMRAQAFAVWGWAVVLPVALLGATLLSAARDVVAQLSFNGAVLVLLLTLASMALLGALLGAETARLATRPAPVARASR